MEKKKKKKSGAPKGHRPYNENGEGGRPKKWTDEAIEKEAEAFDKWISKPTSIWFEKFAFERGYPAQNLSEWAQKNKRFSEAYKRAKLWQKIKLIEGGLFSKFNSKITTLLLSHEFQINEQSNVHQTGDSTVQIVHFGGNPEPWKNEEVEDER